MVMLLVHEVGEVISLLHGVEDGVLVVLLEVMLVGAGVIVVAHTIGSIVWMDVVVDVDRVDLITEETSVIGVEAEVTVVVLKESEHGVTAEVAVAVVAVVAVVEAGVGVVVGAEAGAGVGLAVIVEAVAVAVAAIITRDHVSGTGIEKMTQLPNQ